MIAVIFEVWPKEAHRQDYLDLAASLRPHLEALDGFVSIERFESLTEPGKILSLSIFRDEAAVEAWRNLGFHTGDAGFVDAEGRIHYVDRIKDCIRRRGENISSFEVEQVLNNHADVAESAVVGIRVEGAGGEEEVKALIVPRPGAAIDNVALIDYCAEKMPRFAVPRFVELVAELEKTPTGKVMKGPLREAAVTEATWDRESVGYVLARR